MKEHLEKRILELSEHLIQLEQNAKLMKQKRAASSVAKFHISTGWLCKKLLASHLASPETGMRISKDKNRFAKDLSLGSLKRIFGSARSIINLVALWIGIEPHSSGTSSQFQGSIFTVQVFGFLKFTFKDEKDCRQGCIQGHWTICTAEMAFFTSHGMYHRILNLGLTRTE